MQRKCVAAVAAFSLMLGACASIVSKSNYPVAINSNPSGANFTITNKDGEIVERGTTPKTVTLAAGSGYFSSERYKVSYEKDGAKSSSTINSGFDGWYIGNVLIGGAIGFLIVDPLTGAMFTLPASTSGTLPRRDAAAETAVKLVSLEAIAPELRSDLIRVDQ